VCYCAAPSNAKTVCTIYRPTHRAQLAGVNGSPLAIQLQQTLQRVSELERELVSVQSKLDASARQLQSARKEVEVCQSVSQLGRHSRYVSRSSIKEVEMRGGYLFCNLQDHMLDLSAPNFTTYALGCRD